MLQVAMSPKGQLNKKPAKINEPEASTSTLSPELEQQFEAELCWCIQQLQSALKSGKLNNKQVQDHTKSLNALMSNSAPMVKKRQVMRLSFGDYRAKMAAEEKKSSKSSMNIRVKPGTPSKKSIFVKKSTSSFPGNVFKFNFPRGDSDDLSSSVENVKIDSPEAESEKGSVFKPSDNSFRFSFSIKES